jgi:hypothetical protein
LIIFLDDQAVLVLVYHQNQILLSQQMMPLAQMMLLVQLILVMLLPLMPVLVVVHKVC